MAASGWNPICFPKAKWSPNSRKDDESEGDLDFEQLGWRCNKQVETLEANGPKESPNSSLCLPAKF